MGSFITKRWVSERVSGLPRAERRPCEYRLYIPDALAGRVFRLDGDVAADVADAENAISRLDARVVALAHTEALARLLLRAESVASSCIEGLRVGPRRLLRAEAAVREGHPAGDMTAEEVLGNIDAMNRALALAEGEAPITVDTLLDIHKRLLEPTRLKAHAGRVRECQNWIGGNEFNPCAAAYVPPPPEMVPGLLEDLCEFCNSDMLPAVAQAAIAHAQLEAIHPFADGNGRAGRALIHLILRRRGLITSVQPPVSLVLAARAKDYIHALTTFRFDGDLDSPEADEGANTLVATVAAACSRSVDDAVAFEDQCAEMTREWRSRLERVRAGSALDLLLTLLPGTPVVTVRSAMELTGRSKPQVNAAVARLVDAGILKQVTAGRRNRAFEATGVIDAFADLERILASPSGSTTVEEPARPVPERKR